MEVYLCENCQGETTEWKCTRVKICEGEITEWKCTHMKTVKVRIPSGSVPVRKLSMRDAKWECTCVKIVIVRHQVEVYQCKNLLE